MILSLRVCFGAALWAPVGVAVVGPLGTARIAPVSFMPRGDRARRDWAL